MATWQHLRSSTANKRPTTSLADGRIAINTNTASPGLFFKDSAGTGIVKVGPVHVGTTAPNSSPAVGGSSGNYTGEQWLDTSVSPAQMKVWNGSTWVGIVADELPVSKLQDGAPRQLIQTDAAGTGVEWTSNVDVPGTLDVTSTATFDSIAQHPLGTAGAPTITFTGDNNTGIYSPGADQLALSTNGTGRLFVDASGNVGVGISNPDQLFHISSGSNTRAKIATTSTAGFGQLYMADENKFLIGYGSTHPNSPNQLALRNNTGDIFFATGTVASTERLRITSAGLVGIGTSSPGVKIEVSDPAPPNGVLATFRNSTAAGGTYAGISLNNSGGTNQSVNLLANRVTPSPGADFVIQVSDSAGTLQERLRITETGLLGIGITPEETLDVNGAVVWRGSLNSGKTSAGALDRSGNELRIRAYGATAGTGQLVFRTGGGGGSVDSEAVRIDANQRLLVGTSSSLQVSGVDNAIQVEGTNTVNTHAISAVRHGSTVATAGPVLSLGRSRGTSVGSKTAVANGDTLGTILFAGANGTDFSNVAAWIRSEVDGDPFTAGDTTDLPGRLVFSTTADGANSPTEAVRIDSNQRVGIGVTVIGTYRLHVANDGLTTAQFRRNTSTGGLIDFNYAGSAVGSISTNGSNTSYNTSSDYRLKENVTAVTDGITRLQQLKPSRFNFIADPTKTVDGFLAHEVQTIVPEAITGEKDAVDDEGNPQYQGIDQSKLVPLLTAALQEAIGEIESLKARVAALESA